MMEEFISKCTTCIMARPVRYNGELEYQCTRSDIEQSACYTGVKNHYVPRKPTRREAQPDELHEQIKATLEPKLKERFIVGMKAGYDAAMLHIYKVTKDMTSAKAIRAYIKQKVDEGAARHLAAKEGENG